MKFWSCWLLACTLSLAPMLAAAQTAGQNDDKVVDVASDDPDMVAAIELARGTLDKFLAIADAPPANTGGFRLKVMIRDGDSEEHFWVMPFRRTVDGFVGVLANEPQVVRNVVNGQNIKFSRSEISDWGFTRNGRQVGSFTVCVLFKKMTKEEVDKYRTNYGFDC